MAYEDNYRNAIACIAKLDKEMRQMMKGFYRREMENKKMREAISLALEAKTVQMDQETRAVLLEAVDYHPWSAGKDKANRVADHVLRKVSP